MQVHLDCIIFSCWTVFNCWNERLKQASCACVSLSLFYSESCTISGFRPTHCQEQTHYSYSSQPLAAYCFFSGLITATPRNCAQQSRLSVLQYHLVCAELCYTIHANMMCCNKPYLPTHTSKQSAVPFSDRLDQSCSRQRCLQISPAWIASALLAVRP